MPKFPATRPLLWLMLLAGLLAFAFQGSRGLWEPDEGRYTNVALQMMDSGDYLMPHRHHGSLHVTKPPVTYWALAGSFGTFGRTEWAARTPMALAYLLTVFLAYRLGRLFTPARPWLPALLYAISPVPFLAANAITTDTLLAFAETAAVCAYALRRFGGARPRQLDLMWLLFGLAFMIKGPPGLLPLAAIVVFEWRSGGLPALRGLLRPAGLALFVAAGLGWFVFITQQRPELLDYFLRHEVVERVASATHDRNSQWYGGFSVYLPVLLAGALPWLLALLADRRRPALALDAQTRFLLLWLLLPLLVFMLSRSRLPFYILPLFVPLALLAARTLDGVAFGRRQTALLAVWLVCLLALKGTLAHWPYKDDTRAFAAELRPMLPTEPRELAFIGSKAAYGLNFYLGAEIEKISVDDLRGPQPLSDAEYDQDLRSELHETEPQRYFLVPEKQLAAFLAVVGERAELKPQRLGTVRRYAVYRIERTP
jgi:4-amino-4-deoxy-L-arabinose transferase-like glycosyltransferase